MPMDGTALTHRVMLLWSGGAGTTPGWSKASVRAQAEPMLNAWAAKLLGDPALAAEMGAIASARSRKYSWSITAARLRRLYGDLVARGLVRCD
jgi:hypothetical protein